MFSDVSMITRMSLLEGLLGAKHYNDAVAVDLKYKAFLP